MRFSGPIFVNETKEEKRKRFLNNRVSGKFVIDDLTYQIFDRSITTGTGDILFKIFDEIFETRTSFVYKYGEIQKIEITTFKFLEYGKETELFEDNEDLKLEYVNNLLDRIIIYEDNRIKEEKPKVLKLETQILKFMRGETE